MKQRISVILIAIVSVTVLYLIGHTILVPYKQDSVVLPHVDNAETIYTNAASKIDLSEDTTLTFRLTEEMNVDGAIFQEVAYRTVNYDIQASGVPYIQVHESRYSGTHTIEISETFANDIVYLTVNDTPFSSACDTEQYVKSQIPAIILSPNLYNNIEAVDTGSAYMITFSKPIVAEEWLKDSSITLLDAKGIARVSYDGELETSTYNASYQLDGITFRITTDVSIAHDSINVTLPDDLSSYTPIRDWQAPKLLERACGYLIQAKQISALYDDSIYFEAIGDRREKHVTLHADFDDDWSVLVSTGITTKSETKLNQSQTLRKKEVFLDGQYRISNNDEALIANNSITVDTVYNYFQDQLVSTVMLPQHIRSVEITEENSIFHLSFNGTDAFGSFLAENACKLLYNNPDLMTETGSIFATVELKCYLDIDKKTGLPLASGINYTGSYTAEGLPYSLSYCAEQTYLIPSLNAVTEIEKAAD